MRAIVVYESLWGNTEKLARAIADALRSRMPTEVVSIDAAPDALDGFDLVVIGGPTHAFSMTRPATRKQAVESNGAPGAPERGIREWLNGLTPVTDAIPALAFDTRVESPRLPGSAAKAARHELRSLGFTVKSARTRPSRSRRARRSRARRVRPAGRRRTEVRLPPRPPRPAGSQRTGTPRMRGAWPEATSGAPRRHRRPCG